VFFEPGEDHWHGAAPNRFMTHIAMQEVDDQGSPVTWGEYVRAPRKRPNFLELRTGEVPRTPQAVEKLPWWPFSPRVGHQTRRF
jgi:hypothetical protein